MRNLKNSWLLLCCVSCGAKNEVAHVVNRHEVQDLVPVAV